MGAHPAAVESDYREIYTGYVSDRKKLHCIGKFQDEKLSGELFNNVLMHAKIRYVILAR